MDKFIAKGQAIGLKGTVKIWKNGTGKVCVFGDEFSFTAQGPRAGELTNKTDVPDSKILSFCKEMLAAWPKTETKLSFERRL